MIPKKLSTFKAAPPINPPSMSGWVSKSGGIFRFHAAAVLDPDRFGDFRAVQFLEQAADEFVHGLGLLVAGGAAGADGPDRFVRDHGLGGILGGDALVGGPHLGPDHLFGDVSFALGQGLPYAYDGRQAFGQDLEGLLVDVRVGLAEQGARLGMARVSHRLPLRP